MDDTWNHILSWWAEGGDAAIGRTLLVLVLGLLVARAASAAVRRLLANRTSAQHEMIAQRVTMYGLVSITLIAALHELGFDLSVLVGAAGILTVAIGFASKTAASNIISGMFLMGEKPFSIGDIITVGATTGEVTAIDLLSVKIRTFDNLQVRIPNESLLTVQVTTLSQFPIRRVEINMNVGFDQDVAAIRELLMQIADETELILESPEPAFLVKGLGESGIELMFAAWATRENWLAMRTTLVEKTARALSEAGFELSGPHRKIVFAHRDDAHSPQQ